MSLKITILGCGSSGGVPRIDGDFGACDPSEIKNYRTRCSILVEKTDNEIDYTRVLIDTSPDLRAQLLNAKITDLDGVLFTHDHADQTHGIDDLRAIVYRRRKRIDAYFNLPTRRILLERFGYIFNGYEKPNYPSLLNPKLLPPYGQEFFIDGEGGQLSFVPIELIHGDIECAGFRFDNIAYCNDVNEIPNNSMNYLENLDILIIDCLRYSKHPTHAHLEQTLEWIEKLKPKKSILTNMHIDLDYNDLKNQLPEGIIPAFDGMIIEA
ncbi:MAG: MBL fold metallo-hydrolase [Caulobacterales bacterium]|nr:MBL fold metallo-hydrolase [Caulobacterales bacterium]MCA0373126.1 MBL fold metallo-hydrolase [Pseudomonadota bacterium]